jgi:hypothetical protein
MIAQERRENVDGHPSGIGSTISSSNEGEIVQLPTPAGRSKLTRRKFFKLLAVIMFIILLNVKTVEGEQANRCFAILVFSTILWATGVIGSVIRSSEKTLIHYCRRPCLYSLRLWPFRCCSSGSKSFIPRMDRPCRPQTLQSNPANVDAFESTE